MADWNHRTKQGFYFLNDSKDLLMNHHFKDQIGQVQLILTSPPFPLNNKKSYDNLSGNDYKEWFVSFSQIFKDIIAEDGSIVIEIGNAWEPRRPIQSFLSFETIIDFAKAANLRLCQQFVCYNPSKLPTPAEWVTVNRIRTIDSFTHVWWLSKTDFPKANNRNILRPYSKAMQNLLRKGKYNAGRRPSEHVINDTSFLKDNGGSIMPNVIELESDSVNQKPRLPENLLKMSNSNSNDLFMKRCKQNDIIPHPARMPLALATFFIDFLTDENDLVLDPFAGSNTTGFAAQVRNRRWIAIEKKEEYAIQSKFRLWDYLEGGENG